MFCRDKNISRDKHNFVATKLVKTNICRDKHNLATTKVFSATNTCLSRRNTPFVEIKLCKYHFCRDKTFVATKIILVQLPPMIDFVPTCIALVCHI